MLSPPGSGIPPTPKVMKNNPTSWEKSASWYSKSLGNTGDYYHQKIVIPNSLRLLGFSNGEILRTGAQGVPPRCTSGKVAEHLDVAKSNQSLIDFACGEGILARSLPKNIHYLGLDISSSLIKEAQKKSRHDFQTADISKLLPIPDQKFSHAAIILALQNIDNQETVIKNASNFLQSRGQLLIVLNHPAFRIPRQSSWEIDSQNKLEYRRINRYLSPLKIPITTHPGESNSPITWSFHHSISHYFKLLNQNGFVVTNLEEWASDKESVGKGSRMENRARSEFPLFMAIMAQKHA